jgi:biotin carboxyl carrier protein
LPRYNVRVNAENYTVAVDHAGKDKYRATLNTDTYETEPIAGEKFSVLLIRSGDQVVRAQTRVLLGDKVEVWTGGVPFTMSVQPVMATDTLGPPRISSQLSGEIRAPMPGRVTGILANEGDSVEIGTPLLILEAMKMQNEITSPITGKVGSVRVHVGDSVKKEFVLMTLE